MIYPQVRLFCSGFSAALFHTLSCGGQIFRAPRKEHRPFLHVAHFLKRGESRYTLSSWISFLRTRRCPRTDEDIPPTVREKTERRKPFSACRWSEISRFSEFSSISDFSRRRSTPYFIFGSPYSLLHFPSVYRSDTFQTMSYSLDVYRGTITPRQKNFIDFGALCCDVSAAHRGSRVVRYSDMARELDCRTENLNGLLRLRRTQAYMRTCEKGADRKHHGGGRRSPV